MGGLALLWESHDGDREPLTWGEDYSEPEPEDLGATVERLLDEIVVAVPHDDGGLAMVAAMAASEDS